MDKRSYRNQLLDYTEGIIELTFYFTFLVILFLEISVKNLQVTLPTWIFK